MQNFLDLPSGSTRPGGPSGGAAQLPSTGGGAASDFLRDRPQAGQTPGGSRGDNRTDRVDNRQGNQSNRQDTRTDRRDGASDNRADRTDNRQDTRSDRQDTRTDRQDTRTDQRDARGDNRSDRRDNLTDHRADRIDNMQQRKVDRGERRDQVRDQFRDNHPRAAFWKDNPYWARWRWNTPYRRTAWAALAGWASWGAGASYSYGENVYYQEGDVYYGDSAVATEEEYATQAQAIATSAPAASPETANEGDWLPLGMFAVTADGESAGPPPSMFLQLAVSKQGVIAGSFYNSDTDTTQQIEGAVDMRNQRTAWGVAGKEWPIMEAGLQNLTGDTAPTLVHFADGQTQQWLLVPVEDPQAAPQQP